MNEHYINIKDIAHLKGLKSTRSIRIAIQKGKYVAREVKVNGGTSYEILYSSLESEIQEKLEDETIKSINLTKHVLEKRGFKDIPCNLTFRRFAKHFKKTNYSKWVLMREGEKAYHDKVEAYIERDISKLEVGDVLIADGHVLNFQVINPFTGKPTRATLVGFLDWKSTALKL